MADKKQDQKESDFCYFFVKKSVVYKGSVLYENDLLVEKVSSDDPKYDNLVKNCLSKSMAHKKGQVVRISLDKLDMLPSIRELHCRFMDEKVRVQKILDKLALARADEEE